MNSLLMATLVHCYVGCNTGSADLQALHVLEFDSETGAAKVVQSVQGVQGTTYFQLDRDERYLYSVIGERRGAKTVGSVVRFALDGWRVGRMERLAELLRNGQQLTARWLKGGAYDQKGLEAVVGLGF